MQTNLLPRRPALDADVCDAAETANSRVFKESGGIRLGHMAGDR